MAGEAKTSEFLLSTATLMIGPQAKVMELNPAEHSIGLVKNVQANAETGFTELTQGIQAQVVASVNTSNQTRISSEVYEYTARNMAYGAMLNGADEDFAPITEQYALGAPVTAGGVTLTLAVGSGSDFSPGDYVTIQDTNVSDRVHIGKVASIAEDVLTLGAEYAMAADAAFSIATTAVFKVRSIMVGAVDKQPTFGMKAVGLLPESGQPVTLIFPKIKITKGLNLAFQTDNFSNMPFEFTPYTLVPSDPFYADFGNKKSWQILRT